MERSGTSVGGAGHHPDLAELLRREGPFVTVWAGTSPPENRVRELQRTHASPVPDRVFDDLIAAVDAKLAPGAGGLVAVADTTGVLLVEALPQPPRHDLERIEALPSISPLIEHRQSTVPCLMLVIDRRGADLVWSTGAETGSSTVDAPEDLMIQKFKDSDSGSGYRQHDFQQKVEQNWDHVAADVAHAVTERLAEIRPRVVTVAGDVRMVQLLRRHLPNDVAAMLRDVPGSRSADGSEARRADVIRKWIRTAVAEDTVEVLKVFERERGEHDRAADGVEATLQALCEARVDVLLVHDDPQDRRCAWFAPEQPALVALDRSTIEAVGVTAREGRLIDVAIRSALATSAGVRVVPGAGPVHDGLGAILRW